MSYEILTSRMSLRPITRWPGDLLNDSARRRSPFDSPWRKTLLLLDRELDNIGAQVVVMQVAMVDADFRLDGLPRANAKPAHPGVILGFNPDGESSRRLQFATDVFISWQDNLRAIALALEALRKVDRYGVTSGNQQYAGFREITMGDDGKMGLYTKTEALDFIHRQFRGNLVEAIKQSHPDRGGDPETFRRVMRAKVLIEG